MPREFILVTHQPVSLDDILLAGLQVDPSLASRTIFGRQAVQLCDDRERAIITIEGSRQLAGLTDAVQITPTLRMGEAPWWWTEGCAPWGGVGDLGVKVLAELAMRLHGSLTVEDGE